jgi:hypothetical protein
MKNRPLSDDFGIYNASGVPSRLERFFLVKENIFVFKTYLAARAVVNFYSTSVVTHCSRIGSCYVVLKVRCIFSRIGPR